jgi:O-antigen ligase
VIGDWPRGLETVVRDWWWRAGVTGYAILTVLRGLEGDGPKTGVLQAAQFAAIAFALVGSLVLEWRAGTGHREPLPALRTPFGLFITALGVFLFLAAISTALGVDPAHGMAQLGITVLMLAFVLTTAATRWRRDPGLVRADFAWWVGLAATAHAVGIVIYVARPDLVTLYEGSRFFGVFTNSNFCGLVAASALALAVLLLADRSVARRLRPLLVLAIVPLSTGLYLSGSRTSLIAAAVATAITLVAAFRRRIPRALVIVAAVAIVALAIAIPVTALRGPDTLLFEPYTPAPTPTVPQPGHSAAPPVAAEPDPGGATAPATTTPPAPTPLATPETQPEDLDVQSSGRLTLAREAISVWLRAPVLGHGFRASASLLGGVEPHNLVLQVLVETGVLGLVPLGALLVAMARGLLQRPRAPRFLGLVAGIAITESLTSTAFGWGAPVALIMWLTLAAVFVWPRPQVEESAEPSPRG